MRMQNQDNAGSGGQGELTVFSDQHRMATDLNMTRRAVRERWPITPEKLPIVVDRLVEIVQRKTVDVIAGEGIFPSVYHADANALKAASVLRSMKADNQADDHHEDDVKRGKGEPNTVSVNVGVVIPPPVLKRIERT